MAHFVVREIDRPDPAVMAGLRDAGAATLDRLGVRYVQRAEDIPG
jgi:hypothetical protein